MDFWAAFKATILLLLLDDSVLCMIAGALSHFFILFHVVLNACLAVESMRLVRRQRKVQPVAPASSIEMSMGKPPEGVSKQAVAVYVSLSCFVGGLSTLIVPLVSPGFGSSEAGSARHYCHMAMPSNQVDIPSFFGWIWLAVVVCMCCNIYIACSLYRLTPDVTNCGCRV